MNKDAIYDDILKRTINGKIPNQFIVDIETTQRAPEPLFNADPFYKDNEIILVGVGCLKIGSASYR